MIGETLGPYTIIALLGRGGMGSVYRARVAGSGGEVALKVLAASGGLDPVARERFEQEASLLAGLKHPNVVAVLGALGTDRDRAFFAMELVAGRSLDRVLAERGKLSPGEAVSTTRQVLAGLAAAHERGVVHRDVKASNVLLARGGTIKVVDFGLARALDATRLTRSGHALGTPFSMSPEQAEGKATDARSDVYSAGILLWELLAGRPPFMAESPLAVLRQHIAEPLPTFPGPLPPGLEGTLRTALAKDPARRFADAGDFARALEGLAILPGDLAGLAGVAETEALPVASPAREATRTREGDIPFAVTPGVPGSRRRLGPLLVVGALVAAAALTAAVGLTPRWTAALPLVEVETLEGEKLEGHLVSFDAREAVVETPTGERRTLPRDRVAALRYR